MSRFKVVEINPNDAAGGGGCVCSEVAHPDCKPPYAVFYHNEMDNPLSPHVVICERCALEFIAEVERGDVLSGGESGPEVIDIPQIDVTEVEPVAPRHDADVIPEI